MRIDGIAARDTGRGLFRRSLERTAPSNASRTVSWVTPAPGRRAGEAVFVKSTRLASGKDLGPARDTARRAIAVERYVSARGLAPPLVDAWYGESVIEGEAVLRLWLVHEAIEGHSLDQRDDDDSWSLAADLLARTHSRVPEEEAAKVGLPAANGLRDHHLRRALDRLGDSPIPDFHPNALADEYRRSAERLDRRPATLVHGECFARHVLVPEKSDDVRLVDWEDALLGPAAQDVEALTWGLDPAHRSRFLRHYLRDGDRGPSSDHLEEWNAVLRDAMICNRVTYIALWEDASAGTLTALVDELREALGT